MAKTGLIKLKGGSQVSFGGYDLGYTRGIRIQFEKNFHLMNNQKYDAYVGAIKIWEGATIKVGLLEYTDNAYLLFDESFSFDTLDIYGTTFAGVDKNFHFYKVFRYSLEEFTLAKDDATLFQVTFQAVLNDDGNLSTYND